MIEKKKQEYTAPMVEMIEARVEKGFQSSTTDGLRGSTAEKVGDSGNSYDNRIFN